MIAFAAKAGSVALDGEQRNSPFTKALVRHLATPGLDILLAFGKCATTCWRWQAANKSLLSTARSVEMLYRSMADQKRQRGRRLRSNLNQSLARVAATDTDAEAVPRIARG
jgi:uncharacterized caspase-like protein